MDLIKEIKDFFNSIRKFLLSWGIPILMFLFFIIIGIHFVDKDKKENTHPSNIYERGYDKTCLGSNDKRYKLPIGAKCITGEYDQMIGLYRGYECTEAYDHDPLADLKLTCLFYTNKDITFCDNLFKELGFSEEPLCTCKSEEFYDCRFNDNDFTLLEMNNFLIKKNQNELTNGRFINNKNIQIKDLIKNQKSKLDLLNSKCRCKL